ncbi:Hsp70 family protein [Actinoplanes sp. Pm04-4]|uniref:Hsp70 family protein n=1 Tax=Paractinoplanes pyxinae TaxID=2997416 RepID=A0ABT4B837_9ACTN|nr:Hsp70 family protein [Actinoplanes pyxinae]MCY1142668.1 Hsp70 family protein [Actinoplanes pyxinae]
MTEGFELGVDLGTSHTVAMLRRPDGRTRPLLFDGRPLLPSAVHLDPSGRLHVGADAIRLGHADPGRLEPHPKRHIDEESVMLGDGATVPVADLLAALLSAVAREAVATAGFLPPATVTYPASWGAPRRAVLIEALGRAGWPAETALLPEPVAAARYFAEVLRRPLPVGASLAVFDFGGGTLDVAVVRHDGPGAASSGFSGAGSSGAAFSVTASGGADDLGGLDVDAALVDHLGKSLAGAEPEAWRALTEPVTLAQWRARRQFWEDVRGAKEMLSRSSFAPVPVPGVEQAVHLTRDELEAVADPLVRRGVAEAGAVIKAAGLRPDELAGLFLVGGSSRVPLVARLLHAELGIAPTVLEQPELPVAEGATLPAPRSASSSGPPSSSRPVSGPPTATTAAEPPTAAGGPPTAAGGPPTTAGGPPTAAAGPPTPLPAAPVPAQPAAGSPPPSAPAGRTGDDRHYAEPVDPWATGEAAAIAAGGHAMPGSPSYSGPSAPFGPPSAEPWLASDTPASPSEAEKPRRNRRPWIVAGAAAVAVVVAAGATLTWAFWPRFPSLDYGALGDPVHVTPAIPLGSAWKDAAIRGDRAYLGSADYDTGKVGVVAIDTGATKPAWTNADAGTADRWESMAALPDGVALFSETDYDTDSSQLVVLGADNGEKRWERTLGQDDIVYFSGDSAVVADRAGKKLVGLDLATGDQRWQLPDPEGTPAPTLIAVTTPADLAGPASAEGRALAPDLGDDPRLVQIGADRSARVVNADSGEVLASRANVARPDDEVIAHNGRLIVRGSEDIHRIVAYDLEKLDGDTIAYTAGSSKARLTGLTACGDDRICMIESLGYGDDQAKVVAVDVTERKRVWEAAAPDADHLVPVGEAVLVSYSTTTRLIDSDGKEVWNRQAAAARLNATNVLEFSKPLAGYADDPALAGRHIGDDPVQLGPLADVQTDTCSWNTSHLACATQKDFIVVPYAS